MGNQKFEVEWVDCRDELPPMKTKIISVDRIEKIKRRSDEYVVSVNLGNGERMQPYLSTDFVLDGKWWTFGDKVMAWLRGVDPYITKEIGD